MINANFKLIEKHAKLPEYNHVTDAGMDLFSCESKIIKADSTEVINLGIAWEPKWDKNYMLYKTYEDFTYLFKVYAKVEPRSGLSFKNDIENGAGVIDQDYRGLWKVKLYNFGEKDYEVKVGDKVAQAIIYIVPFVNINLVQELSDTDRGTKGFGSSGK